MVHFLFTKLFFSTGTLSFSFGCVCVCFFAASNLETYAAGKFVRKSPHCQIPKKGFPYIHMRKFRDVSTKLEVCGNSDDVVTPNNLFLIGFLVKQPFLM